MRKNILYFYFIQYFSLINSQEQDSSCTDGKECRALDDCEHFVNEREKLKSLHSNSNEYKTIIENIKNQICNKSLRKVCCVKPEPIITTKSEPIHQDSNCDAGYECIEIQNCQHYQDETSTLKQLNKGSTEYNRKINKLKGLICNKEIRKVCCKSDSPAAALTGPDSPSWVPAPGECGVPSTNPAFILNGEETKPGEYPWMALLGKVRRGVLKWTCGGTLINKW